MLIYDDGIFYSLRITFFGAFNNRLLVFSFPLEEGLFYNVIRNAYRFRPPIGNAYF